MKIPGQIEAATCCYLVKLVPAQHWQGARRMEGRLLNLRHSQVWPVSGRGCSSRGHRDRVAAACPPYSMYYLEYIEM